MSAMTLSSKIASISWAIMYLFGLGLIDMFISSAYAEGTQAGHVGQVMDATEVAHNMGEAAHSGGLFPPFDTSTFASQLFWLAITFGFFLWFMTKIISPRIGSILETRQDRIAQDLDKARSLRDEADASIAAYEQELADAKAKAHDIGQKARDKAKNEAAAELQNVEAELASKLKDAELSIAKTRTEAMSEVGGIAEETASEIFSQLLGGSATKADLAKAVEAAGK